jgi:hypothetical protein
VRPPQLQLAPLAEVALEGRRGRPRQAAPGPPAGAAAGPAGQGQGQGPAAAASSSAEGSPSGVAPGGMGCHKA